MHLYGNPADMPAIAAAAPGIPIVEDAAQAHGARYHGRAVGSDSAAASYSFYPGKTLGAYGDAGAVTTADPELALRLRRLRDHGRFGAKYEHASVGTNARMAEIQAAVLRTKLAHLPAWVAARQRLCGRYEERLAGVRGPPPAGRAVGRAHLAPLRAASPRSRPARGGARASAGSRPASTTRSRCTASRRWPARRTAFRAASSRSPTSSRRRCLSLPIYPELGDDGVDRVAEARARRARRRACLSRRVADRPLRILGVGRGRSLIFLRWAWALAELGHDVHIVSPVFRDDMPEELSMLTAHDITKLGIGTRIPGFGARSSGPPSAGSRPRSSPTSSTPTTCSRTATGRRRPTCTRSS